MRSILLTASFPPALGGVETLLYQTNRRLAEPPLVLAPAVAGDPLARLERGDDPLLHSDRADDPLAHLERGDDPLLHSDRADDPFARRERGGLAGDISVRRVAVNLAGRLAYRPLWRVHPSLHYLQTFWRPALIATATWRPGVIQAGHIYLAPLAWLLARRLRLPFVVYAYGQEVWRGGRPMGLKAVDDRLRGGALRAANRVFVPGTFTAGLLADWQVNPERIVTVPYGAEPRTTPPAGPQLAAPQPEGASPSSSGAAAKPSGTAAPSAATLLTVARLIPRKGIDTVIRALPSLPSTVEYRVVGGGPDEPRLRQLATAVGVAERVHFLGRLDDQALADEYRRCTLFVLPARRTTDGDLEGYGLVYFEAAAWGRPVVAGSSGGEVDAVVDGETGVLVDGDSVEDLSHTLQTLLASPARRESLGAAGRHRVETTHNWPAAARVVENVLADVSVRNRPPPRG